MNDKEVSQLFSKLDNLERLLINQPTSQPEDRCFDLDGLVEYDPERRSKQTFYRYVQNREIPFQKGKKKLTFLKSEIDMWLKEGRKKTKAEIAAEANTYVKIKPKK